MLPNSAEHRRRDRADDLAGVVATDSSHVAYSLGHRIVMIAEDLRKRGGPLRIFSLHACFAMNRIRSARARVRGDCCSYQGNRGIDRPLSNNWINAKPPAHLFDSRTADLLLNLVLN
jgi:hypothetical protein